MPPTLQVSTDGGRDYRLVAQRFYEREPTLTMGRSKGSRCGVGETSLAHA
jgi:hypothetical protein